jgi:hypothetical protein
MGNASSSPKQVQPASGSSSPEQTQPTSGRPSRRRLPLIFEPSSPDSEPVSVSKGPSEDVLPKTVDFIDPKLIRDLIGTGNSIGSSLAAPLLKTLASEKNPDRATSRFIADAIGDNGDTCLWLNAKFKDGTLPMGLSIHVFTKAAAKQISSYEMRAMIIQLSEPFVDFIISEFLMRLFSEGYFKNLRCLMFYGIRLPDEFPQWIEALGLELFHMAKFGFGTSVARGVAHLPCNTLKRLYVVHPDGGMLLLPPDGLEKLVIYCPESSENVINAAETHSDGLSISPSESPAFEEM